MSIAHRLSIPAIIIAATASVVPSIGHAQSMMSSSMMSSAGQQNDDHAAHHQGSAPMMSSGAGNTGMMQQGFQSGSSNGGMMNGDTGRMMSMMQNMMNMISAQSGMMFPNVEGRIAYLKTELQITDSETPQWNHFADALRATGKSMNGLYQQMMQPPGTETLPARLQAQENLLSAHLTTLKALQAALTPLYASFSDEQKKRADTLLIGPMGMM
jgi:hypothetical protein